MFRLKDQYITKSKEERIYNCDIPIIGLSGGIASGKSTVLKMLQEQGFYTISADKLVKRSYEEPETLDFISLNFSSCYLNKQVDFKKLRQIIFSAPEKKTILEDFILPRLKKFFLEECSSFLNPQVIVYEMPILFEKNLQSKVDLVVCIYSSEDQQIERIIKRDHVSCEDAKLILTNQISIEDKRKMADVVIDNQTTPDISPLLHFVDQQH